MKETKPAGFKRFEITERMSFAEKVEQLLSFGLRNRWYVVGPSAMVGSEPVAFTRCGEQLVAWRDAAGKLSVLADWCPHRGAPLSQGQVCESGIRCRYHHVEVSRDGVVARVPGYPSAQLVGRKLVRAYPAVEHFQAIFVWFGEGEPRPLDLPQELLSAQWTGFFGSVTWKCNRRYVLDNVIDIMHPNFLHAEGYMLPAGQSSDEVIVEPRSNGVVVRRKFDATNVDQMEVVDNGFLYERLGVFPAAGLGPADAPILRIIPTVTPIDDENCQFNVWRLRKAQGWQAAMFRFMFNTLYEQRTWDLIEQDREMLESMPPYPPAETLYQHDQGVIALRRYLREQAEAEVRAMHGEERSHVVPLPEKA
jgi:phenylpropionate dioxygenase-like ring-hydroxylating dioxygenase large terminal subunit